MPALLAILDFLRSLLIGTALVWGFVAVIEDAPSAVYHFRNQLGWVVSVIATIYGILSLWEFTHGGTSGKGTT